jgi:hypothetical protein
MKVNPLAWYATRQLPVAPPHFIKCATPVTEKSLLWILTKLMGRYATEDDNEEEGDYLLFVMTQHVSFEDPGEAMLYELRWSGTK